MCSDWTNGHQKQNGLTILHSSSCLKKNYFRIEGLAEIASFAQVHQGTFGVHLRGTAGRDRGSAGQEGCHPWSARKNLQEHQPHQGEAAEDSEALRHAGGKLSSHGLRSIQYENVLHLQTLLCSQLPSYI